MATITEIREKYPQYADLSDEKLARALHAKFYSDLDFGDFSKRVGLASKTEQKKGDPWGVPNLAGLKQGAGLAARTITEAVTDIPTMLADIPVHAINAFGGNVPTFAASRDALLTPAYGTPQTNIEKGINIAGRGALGAGTSAATAASALPWLAAGAGRNVTAALASRPALQMVSGATGAGSSELARQQGAGPVGQIAAGLAGAIAPAALAPRALPVDPQSFANQVKTQAAARAGASAQATPGVASAEGAVSAAPEIRISGGQPRPVGPDPSAGLSIPQQRVMAEGLKLGMRTTPGQATGSKALQQLEARLESQPATSGPFNTLKANNAKVLQRAAAQSIGESSDTVDDAVLARADDRIGAVFDDVADDTARTVDTEGFVKFIGKLQSDTRGLVKGVASHPLVEDVIGFAREGQATGRQLQAVTSKLGKAAKNEMSGLNGDRELGLALYRVKEYVDDLLGQGLSVEKGEAFARARSQYRNLLMLTQRVNTVNPANGIVNPRTLAAVLQTKDKGGYLYGRNQSALYNATRFAQTFAPIVGDSGTATRMGGPMGIDALIRIPFNIGARLYASSPAVKLATGAQAGVRSIKDYPAGVTRAFSPGDFPYSGLFATESGAQ